MRRLLAGLTAAAIVAAGTIWASDTIAQTYQQPTKPAPAQTAPAPAQTAPAPAEKKDQEVVGKIKSMDAAGKKVTLEDGTALTIPDTIKIKRTDLKPGATVKAVFEEKGGEKVVTSMEIQK